jgi:hypothetical protein
MDNAALCLRDLSEEFLGESCEEEEERGGEAGEEGDLM